MKENLAKEKILSSFFNDHPETASMVLMKSDSSQIAQLISNNNNKSLITALALLPVSLLEESLSKLNDLVIVKVIEKMHINLVGSIFHQWKLKNRMDANRIEKISSKLEPHFAASIKTLLQFPTNSIGSIMNPAPFFVRGSLTAGEVLLILKKEKSRYCRYIYIIDESSSLCGVIPFKDIFYAKKDSLLSTLMSSDLYLFRPEDTIRKSYADSCWKKWDTIPVVDEDRSLIGLIRFETLEEQILVKGNKLNIENNEISQATNAISEVFQIGIKAAVSTLMLPLDEGNS